MLRSRLVSRADRRSCLVPSVFLRRSPYLFSRAVLMEMVFVGELEVEEGVSD